MQKFYKQTFNKTWILHTLLFLTLIGTLGILILLTTGDSHTGRMSQTLEPRKALTRYNTDLQKELIRAYCKQYYQKNSLEIDTRVIHAAKLHDEGHEAVAEKILSAVIKENPENLAAYLELIMIEFFIRKKLPESISYISKALEIDPKNTPLLTVFVNIESTRKKYNDGVQFLEELRRKFSDVKTIGYRIAQLKLAAGFLPEALIYLKKYPPDSGIDIFLYKQTLGEVYEKLGQVSQSLTEYTAASEALSEEIRSRLINDEPIELYTLQLDNLQLMLTERLVEQHDYKKAEDILQKLMERLPNDPRVLSILDNFRHMRSG